MPDTTALRWLLLDLDDTLVDTREACRRAGIAAARQLGLVVPTEREFHAVYGRRKFPECVAAWHGPGHFSQFNRIYLREVRYPSIGDVSGLLRLARHQGLRTGVITNSSTDEADRKLRDAAVPVAELEFISTPADQPARKPDSFAFSAVMERHRIDPATALYVSDDPADGRGARGAGMAFRAVLTGIATAADFRSAGTAGHDVFDDVHHAVGPLLDGRC